MTDFDVIVVGAGPAGSTTARRAAQQGLDVLLIDKDEFPRMKPCAGGFTDHVENDLDFDLSEVIQRRAYGQTLVSPSGVVVDCTRPATSGSLYMRTDFDHLLLRKAEEAGAKVSQGDKVTSVTEEDRQVTITTEGGKTYSGSYLVGADGINSVVAKRLGFYSGWSDKNAAVCIEVEAEVGEEAVKRICGVPYDDEGISIHIYFGTISYGYSWCFPKRSILSIGVGCRQDRAKNLRGKFNEWFDQFKKKHDIDPKILSDTAARVPYSGAVRTTVKGRTLLVGDAAGFVNPFDQEGVIMAVKSGIIAAPVLKRAVESANPQDLRSYEKEWKSQFNDVLTVGKKIADILLKSEKNMETICRLALEDPVINQITYELIASLDSYTSLYRKLIKRILLKHPRAGLSLYT